MITMDYMSEFIKIKLMKVANTVWINIGTSRSEQLCVKKLYIYKLAFLLLKRYW